MEGLSDIHYIPGWIPNRNKPLDRYLPPFYKGVATTWLAKHIPNNGWLLDPFGAAPDLPIEAARNGYRVIVSANNPVNRFILEILANPPERSDFKAALATLASLQVGKDRLEPHIKSLYSTICNNCHQNIQADVFLWRRGDTSPYAKIYTCPFCSDSGERPVIQGDIEKAERFTKTGLHHARALERVAPLHDPDRQHVVQALDVYLPRALYALVTIINKLNSIPPVDHNRRLLSALLLLAFDRTNTLWPYPKERQRPKQLTVPSQFREHNVWQAIESAVNLWEFTGTPIPIVKWPEHSLSDGGICLFEGRIKELSALLPQVDICSIITTFPRPNQAFWTLSALWSGWLWGYEAVEHFKSVLRRRRYDWGWHTTAIHHALGSLADDIPEETPFFGLINEVEPGFLAAVTLATQLVNLDLCGIALRSEDGQAQITWKYKQTEVDIDNKPAYISQIIQESARNHLLKQRGEPSPYPYIHAAGLAGVVKRIPVDHGLSPSEYLSKVQSSFHQGLSYNNGFLRFGGSDKSLEIGEWWIKTPTIDILPLTDRIEMVLVNHLIENPGSSFHEIDTAICANMNGLTPPWTEIIQVCLQSYGYQDPPGGNHWFLHKNDAPEKRKADIHAMAGLLLQIGKRLSFDTQKESQFPSVIRWTNADNQKCYEFYIAASALLGRFLDSHKSINQVRFLVLPGSRANLIAYKLHHNTHLQQQIQNQLKFIKFRHLRQLTESATLNLENLDEQLSLDPLTYSQPQIRFL